MNKKYTILITNDDGITAPGIKNLISVAKKFGTVVVVAPDSPQSAMGHAITISKPIRLQKIDLFKGIESYQCSGTPVDCVKLAVDQVLHHQPDIVLSGINHGSNASINVLYSGTMSAAMEGAIEGIPSIGFSLCDYDLDADFSFSLPFIEKIIAHTLQEGLPKGTLLNVNIPKGEEIKGIKICRQAGAKWEENFVERTDPHGRNYYWLVGMFKNEDHGSDTDLFALEKNYISIVPTQFDLTAHHFLHNLNNWNLNETAS